jgi:hypothetical protein
LTLVPLANPTPSVFESALMPLRPLLLLAATGAALAIAPAVALAVPPENDNYLGSTAINTPGTSLRAPTIEDHTYTNTVDTTEATIQSDLFNPDSMGQPFGGAGAENTVCNNTQFGKTVWYDFHPKVDGGVQIHTSGTFDSVVTLYEWDDRQNVGTSKITRTIACHDELGLEEDLIVPAGKNVKAGHAYTVQVGGVAGPAGAAGGSLTFNLDFFADSDGDGFYDNEGDRCRKIPGPRSSGGCPPPLNIAPSLGFDDSPNGIRINKLVVSHAPKGALVVARCRGCKTQKVRSKGRPINFKKVLGANVPAGSKVTVLATLGRQRHGRYRFGATGELVSWPVHVGAIGNRRQQCVQVGTKSKIVKCP